MPVHPWQQSLTAPVFRPPLAPSDTLDLPHLAIRFPLSDAIDQPALDHAAFQTRRSSAAAPRTFDERSNGTRTRAPLLYHQTSEPPNLQTSEPHRRDTRLRGASVVSHKFVYRGGRVSPPRFGRRACRLAFAIRGLSMRAIPTPRRGRQIAEEMPYHPSRLLRECNLPRAME